MCPVADLVNHTLERRQPGHHGVMQHFSVEGSWWLPEAASPHTGNTDVRLSGSGTHRLRVASRVRHADRPRHWARRIGVERHSVRPWPTHNGRDVTLFEAGGVAIVGPFTDVQETYHGQARTHRSSRSCSARSRKRGASSTTWTRGLTRRHSGNTGEGRPIDPIDFSSQELAHATVDSDEIRLKSGVHGTSGDTSIHLDRWTAFVIKLLVTQRQWTTCTRSSSTATARLANANPRSNSSAYLAAAAPCSRSRGKGSPRRLRGGAATDDLGGFAWKDPELLGTNPDHWSESTPRTERSTGRMVQVRAELEEAVVLLLGPFYASFMYGEHRFRVCFQSAEALHRARFPGRELEKLRRH